MPPSGVCTVTLKSSSTDARPSRAGVPLMRWLWFALGWVMVGLGVIGALLPVMPTTIFLILAVGCFARSSPKFEQRLLAHPRYGPSLRLWREQGAVSRKGKAFASAGMAVGFALFCWGAHPSWRLLLGVGLLGGFTTFSAFSLETMLMIDRGQAMTALGYALASVVGAIGALGLGLTLMRNVAA